MTLEEFVNKAIGVPFVDKGRDYTGWDCHGLLRCAYMDVLGVELPSYTDAYRSTKDVTAIEEIFEHERTANWMKVDKPAPMDGILLRLDNRPVHVGVVITHRDFLHTDRGIDTCVQEYTGLEWGLRVIGVFRLKPQSRMAS
ncbi:MAG: NlpC/P60 family protein [Pseudomonadota bacterium]